MQLGRLKKVDPRTIWVTEDMDFTPWLHSLKSAPLSQKDRWPEYLEWMTKTVTAFDTVFRQRVRNLSGTTEPVDNDHP